MLAFNIDISDTVKEFSLQPQEVSSLTTYLLDRVVDDYVGKWMNLVNDGLHGTRDEYKRAVYTERPYDNTAIIGLTSRESKLAMMIETGCDAFTEQEGFKNSPKAVHNGEHWYLTIPFRHATSEDIMSEMVPDSNISILDFMKQGNTVEQENLPEGYNEAQTHSLNLNNGSILTYKHKAPIYEGMHRRDISSTEKEKRGGYFTFRRVSDKTDPTAWMHPGFEAHNFMDKALEQAQLNETVDNAVQDWIDLKLG